MSATFRGAKVLLFLGERLLMVRRDPHPGIVWPGRLDFPGGGREDGESAETCALRETEEEVGLRLRPSDLVWRAARRDAAGVHVSFAARLPAARAGEVRLGAEGTGWTLLTPAQVLARRDAIPSQQDMLRQYMVEGARGSGPDGVPGPVGNDRPRRG